MLFKLHTGIKVLWWMERFSIQNFQPENINRTNDEESWQMAKIKLSQSYCSVMDTSCYFSDSSHNWTQVYDSQNTACKLSQLIKFPGYLSKSKYIQETNVI